MVADTTDTIPSSTASGQSVTRFWPGLANARGASESLVRSALAGLFSALIFSETRDRAWYCNSSRVCRFPYQPLDAKTASPPSATTENISAQNQGESVSGACELWSGNSFHHRGHGGHGERMKADEVRV